jgi:hypothetical protein
LCFPWGRATPNIWSDVAVKRCHLNSLFVHLHRLALSPKNQHSDAKRSPQSTFLSCKLSIQFAAVCNSAFRSKRKRYSSHFRQFETVQTRSVISRSPPLTFTHYLTHSCSQSFTHSRSFLERCRQLFKKEKNLTRKPIRPRHFGRFCDMRFGPQPRRSPKKCSHSLLVPLSSRRASPPASPRPPCRYGPARSHQRVALRAVQIASVASRSQCRRTVRARFRSQRVVCANLNRMLPCSPPSVCRSA